MLHLVAPFLSAFARFTIEGRNMTVAAKLPAEIANTRDEAPAASREAATAALLAKLKAGASGEPTQDAERAYWQLAHRVAAADATVTPDDVAVALRDAGRTVEQFERAVEIVQRRQTLAAQLAALPQAERRLAEIRRAHSDAERLTDLAARTEQLGRLAAAFECARFDVEQGFTAKRELHVKNPYAWTRTRQHELTAAVQAAERAVAAAARQLAEGRENAAKLAARAAGKVRGQHATPDEAAAAAERVQRYERQLADAQAAMRVAQAALDAQHAEFLVP